MECSQFVHTFKYFDFIQPPPQCAKTPAEKIYAIPARYVRHLCRLSARSLAKMAHIPKRVKNKGCKQHTACSPLTLRYEKNYFC